MTAKNVRYVKTRNLEENIDQALLEELAASQYWLGVIHFNDMDSKVDYLYGLLENVLNICAPLKTKKSLGQVNRG